MGSTNNRRTLYRFEPPPLAAPRFSITRGDRRVAAEHVIDVNVKGVRVAFATHDLTSLVVGAHVMCVIEARGLAGKAEIRGRVVFSFSRADSLVVAIAFTETPDLGDRVTAEFFSIFNRREDLRTAAETDEPLSALVLDSTGQADGVIELKLRDRSAKGVGFVVDPRTDAFMRDTPGASVAIPLRDDAVTPAQVRRREAKADAVHYGATFEATAP
jgi:hypothetical protein